MKPSLVTIALLAAAAVAFLVYRIAFRETETAIGFMDYVRNPSLAFGLQDEFVREDAEVAALSKEPSQQLVEMLLEDPGMFGIPTKAIREAGPRMVPALLAAISDPRFRESMSNEESGLDRLPIVGVLNCLEDLLAPEAVTAVLPLVADPNEDIRKQVALLLGSIATDEAAAPLRQLLDDKDDYVRGYGVMGILRALKEDRASETFRQQTFGAVAPLVYRSNRSGNDSAQCLLELDKARAVSILTSSERLHPKGENVHEVLEALRIADVKVAKSDLLKILAGWNDKTIEYPGGRVVGQALLMLASVESSKSIDVIDPWLTHSSERIREDATAAKVLAMGLEDPMGFAWDRLESVGWQKLTDPQRHVIAVKMLVGEVENGGFFQYFVNRSGDNWRDAADGLVAIGAAVDKDLFDQAVGLFGPDLPSEDQETRHEQVAKIANRDEEAFSFVEGPFYKDQNDREVLLLNYILKHADDFR
jgi:hypothetical protein